MISEETFMDKDRCDAIRDLVTLSPCNLTLAETLLSKTEHLERDYIIAKELSEAGASTGVIRRLITALNNIKAK